MTTQSTPFFDSRKISTLNMVANLLRYPYEYCRRETNQTLLLAAVPNDDAFSRLVQVIAGIQETIHNQPPLAGSRIIWGKHQEYAQALGIRTILDADPPSLADEQARSLLDLALNVAVLENIVNAIDDEGGNPPEMLQFRLRAAAIWLSHHLALVVLGVARVEYDPRENCFGFCAVSVGKRKHLRRAWFGTAFDEQSLRAASARIEAYAYGLVNPKQRIADPAVLRAEALSVFSQQWRLPIDNGPCGKMLNTCFMPLLSLLVNAVAAALQPGGPYVLQRSHARQLKAEAVFDRVVEMQSKIGLVNRLFDIRDGGLVLGTRKFAPGLLAIAEELAALELGQQWHNDVSECQKRYLIERLNRNAKHIEVLDHELRQSDTRSDTPIDVDLFIRDKLNGRFYAIQLKHLENAENGSFLDWISRFRNPEKGLGLAAKQLQNLKDLISSDQKVANKLEQIGILPGEFSKIVPVVLHNIGTIDLWELQNDVLFYDMHTFCNYIAGRSMNYVAAAGGTVSFGAARGTSCQGSSLDNPDQVITAYLADPHFADLKSFDFAGRVIRSLESQGIKFQAEGLGI